MHQYVAGRRVAGASTETSDVPDPATGDVVETVPPGSPADVDTTVRAARPTGRPIRLSTGVDVPEHVLLDTTAVARTSWHRTVVGDRPLHGGTP